MKAKNIQSQILGFSKELDDSSPQRLRWRCSGCAAIGEWTATREENVRGMEHHALQAHAPD